MARGYRQGWFIPTHPDKYRGNVEKIRYMSSWEQKAHQFLDRNPNILEWSSEEVVIPYIKPTDKKVHKYYPDYWVKYQKRTGEIVEEIWEVKPEKQVKAPKKVGKRRKQQLFEQVTYAINVAKWKYATLFCEKHGMKFRLLTENQLFK